MPRRVNLAMLLGLIVVSVLSFGLTAGAQEEGVGTTDEVAQAQETLAQMRIDQEMAAEEYNAAASTLQGLNGDITGTTQELEAAELRLAEAEAELSNRAGEVYKLGQLAFVDYILDSTSASDFANRMDLLARLLIGEQEEVAQLRAARDELEEEAETRRQQVQNYEQTTAEMEARWDKASALEVEMEDYLNSLNEAVLAEIEAERESQAQAAAEQAESMLLAAQEREAQRAAEEAQEAAEEEAARQAAAAEEALRAAEAAETEQERQQAQAEAEEARAAVEEAERKAAEEASRAAAAAAEQAKKQEAAAEQAKKQEAADEQAALRAEQMKAQRDAEAEAAKNAIAAEEALRILEAAETEQERQQAQAKAQQAEDAAREQARKAAEAQQLKKDAEEALAEERQKAQPSGTQPTTPTLDAAPKGQEGQPNAAAPKGQEGQPNAAAPKGQEGQPNAAAPKGQEGQPNAAAKAPSGAGGAPVAEARNVQGDPYVAGGEAPGGFDCSGLVKWAYRGIMDLPHSVDGIGSMGTRISTSEAGPGDVLVWPGYHVAMVTEPGMMIHASNYHMRVIEVSQGDMEPAAYAVRLA